MKRGMLTVASTRTDSEGLGFLFSLIYLPNKQLGLAKTNSPETHELHHQEKVHLNSKSEVDATIRIKIKH